MNKVIRQLDLNSFCRLKNQTLLLNYFETLKKKNCTDGKRSKIKIDFYTFSGNRFKLFGPFSPFVGFEAIFILCRSFFLRRAFMHAMSVMVSSQFERMLVQSIALVYIITMVAMVITDLNERKMTETSRCMEKRDALEVAHA